MAQTDPNEVLCIGIDLGTQGGSGIAINQDLEQVAFAEAGGYDIIDAHNPEGIREERPSEWIEAVLSILIGLRADWESKDITPKKVYVNISGHMHALVVLLKDGKWHDVSRIWCDARGAEESAQLGERTGRKHPIRMTSVRYLRVANECVLSGDMTYFDNVVGITVPSGFCTWVLGGKTEKAHVVDFNEGGGMAWLAPDGTLDPAVYAEYKQILPDGVPPLADVMPKVVRTGTWEIPMDPERIKELGYPEETILTAPSGDQGVTGAACCSWKAGTAGVSCGTSTCVNTMAAKPLEGVYDAIDVFKDVDGTSLLMGWIKNGSVYYNQVVIKYALAKGAVTLREIENGTADLGPIYDELLGKALAAYKQFRGPLTLPMFDTEPATGYNDKVVAAVVGLSPENMLPEFEVISAVLGSVFLSRLAVDILKERSVPLNELILTGGLFKTELAQKVWAQLWVDVMNIPGIVPKLAAEGCAYGSALLSLYRARKVEDAELTWGAFMQAVHGEPMSGDTYQPDSQMVDVFEDLYARWTVLLEDAHPEMVSAFRKD